MKVFLDDNINIMPDGWHYARTTKEVKALLLTGKVTHLSLDNDLGEDEPEGYTLVRWMIENGIWPSEDVFVHSRNVVRAKEMKEDIARYFSPKEKG
jgi:hypothetical protein